MTINIRPLNTNDYSDILVGWWKDWGFEAPPKDFLPEDGTSGLIVYVDDVPVCAGFIYMTNSKIAWIDWIISNKNFREKPTRVEAIKHLIDTLTSMAKNLKYTYAYALIKNERLVNIYQEVGYTKGVAYTEEMIKLL